MPVGVAVVDPLTPDGDAALNQRAFAVSDRVLHQNGVGQIPMDAGEIFETELLGAIGAIPHTRFHLSLRFPLALAGRFLAPAELPERPPPLHSSASRQHCDPISSRPAAAKLIVPKA